MRLLQRIRNLRAVRRLVEVQDRGGVTTLVAVLLAGGVLIPMSALVVDVGTMYVEHAELANGAESAARILASACSQGKCTSADLATLKTQATKYASANARDGVTQVTEVCGNWGSLPACSKPIANLAGCVGDAPVGTNYVEVRVATKNPDGSTLLPPVFARTVSGRSGDSGETIANCARATSGSVCVKAANAKYKHTFNGPAGTATIQALTPLCPGETQPFSLVSYTAPDDVFSVPQYLYDSKTQSITSTVSSLSFDIDVPDCYAQVDFVFGSDIANPLTATYYYDRKVGSDGFPGNQSTGPDGWWNGGTKMCYPKPAVTFTSKCDGTMQLGLSNGSTANVDAVFFVTAGTGGYTQTQSQRVAKGKSTTIPIGKDQASTVKVLDNTGKTNTKSWSKGGCTP